MYFQVLDYDSILNVLLCFIINCSFKTLRTTVPMPIHCILYKLILCIETLKDLRIYIFFSSVNAFSILSKYMAFVQPYSFFFKTEIYSAGMF